MNEVKEIGRYPYRKKNGRLKAKKADAYAQSLTEGISGMILDRLNDVGIEFPRTLRITVITEVLDKHDDIHECKGVIYNNNGFFANLDEEESEDE